MASSSEPPKPPRRRLRLAVGVALAAVAIAAPSLGRRLWREPYKVPAGGMAPTLLANDHLWVDRNAYGLSTDVDRIERGDVIVFRFPLRPTEDYVKRVVGLPGDVVVVTPDHVEIVMEGAGSPTPIPRTPSGDPCAPDRRGNAPPEDCARFAERLGDRSFDVQYVPSESFAVEPTTFEVPAGHLFVLGDNRSRSHDSSVWRTDTPSGDAPAPFVPVENVKGRVVSVWLPLAHARYLD